MNRNRRFKRKSDEMILREVYASCNQSRHRQIITREVMYRTGRTDIISEGIVIETMKTVVSDAVKNLLSTGAVIVAGGLPADTIVDALYAIEQTKTAINVYNSFLDAKDQANKIVVDFMKAVDSVNLENNIDEIKNIAIQSAVNLGKTGDKLVGDGFAGDVVHDGMIVMEELREKFLTFFKEILGSVANWISTLIPDDGGNVSTFIKVTVFTVVEQGTKKPLSVVDELLQKLPSQVSEIILDEVKLESFLVDICNQVADGIEENKDQIGTALSVGVTGAKIMTGTGRTLFPGMDMMAKGIGKAGQAVTDFVAGEDSTSGKVVRGLLDNQYAFDSIEENIEFIKEVWNDRTLKESMIFDLNGTYYVCEKLNPVETEWNKKTPVELYEYFKVNYQYDIRPALGEKLTTDEQRIKHISERQTQTLANIEKLELSIKKLDEACANSTIDKEYRSQLEELRESLSHSINQLRDEYISLDLMKK